MNEDDYGSRPYRGWSPEQLLELKQEPKKKRKDRGRVQDELRRLFEPKRTTRPTDR